jgi:hypothetical protein
MQYAAVPVLPPPTVSSMSPPPPLPPVAASIISRTASLDDEAGTPLASDTVTPDDALHRYNTPLSVRPELRSDVIDNYHC